MMLQVVVNGIIAGLVWGLLAVGFSLIYSTARVLHAAHASTFLVGAYVGLWLSRTPAIGRFPAGLLAAVAAATLGLTIDTIVYRPLRLRGASRLALFLASLAVVLIVENVVALIAGSEIWVPQWQTQDRMLRILDVHTTTVQLWSSATSVVIFVGTWIFVRGTSLGKKMRAVACDPELARVVGIREERVVVASQMVGSAIAGIAGFLIACSTSATPTMGFRALLIGVTGAIIGGMGSLPGAMLGGLVVGIAENAGAMILPANLQEGVVFTVLLVFLVARPQGMFGNPLRKTTV